MCHQMSSAQTHRGCSFKAPCWQKLSVNVCVLPHTVKSDSDDALSLRHVLERAPKICGFCVHTSHYCICVSDGTTPHMLKAKECSCQVINSRPMLASGAAQRAGWACCREKVAVVARYEWKWTQWKMSKKGQTYGESAAVSLINMNNRVSFVFSLIVRLLRPTRF